MQGDEKAITFRVPEKLRERFKEAAAAKNRSAAGELRHLMEQRVAEHEADRSDSKAAA